jgi:hypothetical protein
MPTEPLRPFAPPAGLEHLNLAITPGVAVSYLLYFIFALWAIYTLIAIYHWLKYSHASSVAFPAIAIHLVISIALMSYALSGTIPNA